MLRNPIRDQIAERDHRQDAIMREGVIALDIERAASGGGFPNRCECRASSIKFFRQRIDGMKLRVIERQIAFHAAEENSHGALLLRPFHFFH